MSYQEFFPRAFLVLFIVFMILWVLLCADEYSKEEKEKYTNKWINTCTDKTTKKLDLECLNTMKKIHGEI